MEKNCSPHKGDFIHKTFQRFAMSPVRMEVLVLPERYVIAPIPVMQGTTVPSVSYLIHKHRRSQDFCLVGGPNHK